MHSFSARENLRLIHLSPFLSDSFTVVHLAQSVYWLAKEYRYIITVEVRRVLASGGAYITEESGSFQFLVSSRFVVLRAQRPALLSVLSLIILYNTSLRWRMVERRERPYHSSLVPFRIERCRLSGTNRPRLVSLLPLSLLLHHLRRLPRSQPFLVLTFTSPLPPSSVPASASSRSSPSTAFARCSKSASKIHTPILQLKEPNEPFRKSTESTG